MLLSLCLAGVGEAVELATDAIAPIFPLYSLIAITNKKVASQHTLSFNKPRVQNGNYEPLLVQRLMQQPQIYE
ncbi:MAG: hypothetical protein KME08_17410 [Aphanothece sp. CMT-3BRIN-NPC111]|nr:hypothetical protein [Aphanothece sp. CMT-3BRIN-NPC111]